ncbi:MAG: DNA (cytosine-5-)-methyltransferase [Coriobacteriaceae bacterium]|jgi:DNA (cytosine-5)-methyltransferase 1|nr:DNA (cytosine-5-)-methyltransferase [Coriobacteriaceae bacterium]
MTKNTKEHIGGARSPVAGAGEPLRVVELFAGVGGFRLALEGNPTDADHGTHGFKVVWANQWEPPGTDGKQFAFRCYVKRFDPEGKHPDKHSNKDISVVLDHAENGGLTIPDHDLLVGGFPCQDYSVAKPLSQADGIEGKKGVLWWEIYRLLNLKNPRYILLENVDRMLKSPAVQRGRDFAIMLSCLARLGYSVEWRVINAADYGFPQRRRRVYLYGEKDACTWDLDKRLLVEGVIAEAFPVEHDALPSRFSIDKDPYKVSESFGKDGKASPFLGAGVMQQGEVVTAQTLPLSTGQPRTLGSVLVSEDKIPQDFYISEDALPAWQYLKGTKKIPRVNKKTGHEYLYSEGGMACPDHLDLPSRTILTGEGGKAASRFKHLIRTTDGRYRRLVPEELEQLQGFPIGWTDTGMSAVKRAFCMGNALVVGIPERIGQVIRNRHR